MIFFLLPVYNEKRNIARQVRDISARAEKRKRDYRICIVDDGSTDGTVDEVRVLSGKLPVEIVSNSRNMGPGAAFDRGFRHILACSKTGDIVVTMEADNTSDLVILDEMLEKAASGVDLVLASCYAENGGVEGTTLFRKAMSRGANFLVRCVSPEKKINTFSSFFRCYRSEILSKAYQVYGDRFIEEKGFTCAVDILLKLQRLGVSIAEVPTVLKCDRRAGRSKMKTLATVLSYVKLFGREAVKTGVRIDK